MHAAGGDVGVAIIAHEILPLLNLGPHEHLGINQCGKAAELAWWEGPVHTVVEGRWEG